MLSRQGCIETAAAAEKRWQLFKSLGDSAWLFSFPPSFRASASCRAYHPAYQEKKYADHEGLIILGVMGMPLLHELWGRRGEHQQ